MQSEKKKHTKIFKIIYLTRYNATKIYLFLNSNLFYLPYPYTKRMKNIRRINIQKV